MTDDELLAQTRDCLEKLGKGRTTLRGDGLADRVAKKLRVSIVDIIPVFSTLKQNNEMVCESWFNGLPLSLVTLNIEKRPASESFQRWQTAMQAAEFTQQEMNALQSIDETVSELNDTDLRQLATGLKSLKNYQLNNETTSRYVISSRHLLGSSKLLDALPKLALKEFGIDCDNYLKPASYVMVAGPDTPASVVLVENPQAMETALTANVPDIAWVATFGYGLSMLGDEYGRQLASIIEDSSRRIYPLVRSGSPPDIETLFSFQQIYFWGDLDLEGLRIYARIKSKLPGLQLSGLYYPMKELLNNAGNSHPYIKLTGKEGQKDWASSDPMLDALIKACRTRGLDQEILTAEDITQYAGSGFTLIPK